MACGDKSPELMGDHPAAKGLAAMRRGDHAEALAQFDALVAREPNGVPGLFLRAEAIERSGDLARARATLLELASRFPFAEGACRERLALLSLRDGDHAAARESLERAIALGWSNTDAITRDPSFEPVSSREDFQALLSRARGNATDG